MLADSDEQVLEFLNIVDLATRFTICFPVPSKRPDDVLSVLEMVCMEVNSRMNSVSLWKRTVRHYFTAAEAPWQNRLVERDGGNRMQGD